MANPTRTIICCGGCEEQTGTKCGHCFEPIEVELTTDEIIAMGVAAEQAEARRLEEEAAALALAALKESARAKLISGQPMTAEEAATIVL